MLANMVERSVPEWRSEIAVATGLIFGSLLFFVIVRTQRAFSIDRTRDHFSSSTLYGLIYGIIAILTSVSFILWGSDWRVENLSMSNIVNQLLFQIRPAVIEEVGFRYGIVVFALVFFGRTSALIVGAVPFGILHLLNFISGQPIYWEYIFCTAVAGLFLTLVFLRHGLGAAILAHYTWNVCAAVFSEVLKIPQERIEGGSATFAVLVGLCLWLGFHKGRIKALQ